MDLQRKGWIHEGRPFSGPLSRRRGSAQSTQWCGGPGSSHLASGGPSYALIKSEGKAGGVCLKSCHFSKEARAEEAAGRLRLLQQMFGSCANVGDHVHTPDADDSRTTSAKNSSLVHSANAKLWPNEGSRATSEESSSNNPVPHLIFY